MIGDTDKHRVLSVHCYYREPGGEDAVFETEARLLAEHGHAVETFVRHNADWPVDTVPQRAAAAAQTIWARRTNRELAAAIAEFRPDVVHVHNTFQRLSPVVYRTCKAAGVPVVQTLHNYRYGCVAATLFRDGHPCEDCVGRAVGWPGVRHACYRGSTAESAVVTAMNATHRAAGSWAMVDRYIALTPFARDRFIAMGIPEHKLVVKAQLLAADPGARPAEREGDYLLFAGRLTLDKGVLLLLDAAATAPGVPLVIVGDGPLRQEVEQRAAGMPQVRVLGHRPRPEVSELMAAARAVVVPSLWYENFPMVVVEAYARGVPVLASDGGSLSDIVTNARTGLLFGRGDAQALGALLRQAWNDPPLLQTMGSTARRTFEDAYSADAGYQALRAIYDDVLQSS